MLHISDLRKRYGELTALDGVSFDVHANEIVGLLGPNGAGKTTAIECILGLRRPDAGVITIAGCNAAADPHRARSHVGAQLQATALQDKITPRQALRLFANFAPTPLDPDLLLERFSLAAKADAKFDTLSGGQRQRLGVALAFVNDPQLIVLDEPATGLDPLARRDLGAVLQQAKAEGRAILFSTHSLEEAQSWCDRVLILHQGRVVAAGPPQQLIDQAAAHPRLRFRITRPLPELPESAVALVRHHATEYELTAADINASLARLAKLLSDFDIQLVDLRMIRPSLEDVFIKLTGSAWADTDDALASDSPVVGVAPARRGPD